jgi:hypothetical protein
MSMVGFPLLLIPLAVYNIIVFLMPGVSLTEPVLRLTLMSGAEWPITLGDMLLALGILLLLLEIIKGARPGAKYLTDHLLSLIVFGAAAAEFLLWPKFGTSIYCLLTLLALVDFISGTALRVRRGTRLAPAASATGRIAKEAGPVATEPPRAPEIRSEPSHPQASSAASGAEAMPVDHPEPKTAQTAAAPTEASPQVQSPGLQPTGGTPASQA